VDDKDAVRRALAEAGVEALSGLSSTSATLRQSHRDRWLRRHPVHQSAERVARHGLSGLNEGQVVEYEEVANK